MCWPDLPGTVQIIKLSPSVENSLVLQIISQELEILLLVPEQSFAIKQQHHTPTNKQLFNTEVGEAEVLQLGAAARIPQPWLKALLHRQISSKCLFSLLCLVYHFS